MGDLQPDAVAKFDMQLLKKKTQSCEPRVQCRA